MIYAYVILGPNDITWTLEIASWLKELHAHDSHSYNPEPNHIASAYTSGAINQQMRQESRSMLLAKLEFMWLDGSAFKDDVVHKIFMIANEREVPLLRPQPCANHAQHAAEFTSFKKLLPLLVFCKNLYCLQLDLYLSYVFHGDRNVLRTFFASGETLISPGLEKLATAIESLRHVKHISLTFVSDKDLDIGQDFDPEQRFTQFAFRDLRELKLYEAIKARLQVNYASINGTMYVV
jgi:hypothetical protein